MNRENILTLAVVLLSGLLLLEIFGVFESEQPNGYSEKEVALIIKVKDLNKEINDLKLENKIIEKDNERISHNIGADSSAIYNGSREYRDSLRAELFGQ